MEIQGKIIAVLPERRGETSRGKWVSQEFVLETSERYPKRVAFSVFGEERLARFNITKGRDFSIKFDIEAREYQGKWYNQITAYEAWETGKQPSSETSRERREYDAPPF